MLTVGDGAPEFELSNQHGEPVRLSSFSGSHVIVYFFPRARTDGCTAQAVGFKETYDAFEEANAAIVGISDDPVEDLAAFADEYALPFDLLSDVGGEVSTIYDAYGEKQLFGNTFEGVYRHTYVVDPEGIIEAAYDDVDPKRHADRVLSALTGS